MNYAEYPHKRLNPLTGEWVLVSPHRTKRPWHGKVEDAPGVTLPKHDPGCYLCPGNQRAGGIRNPQYTGTYVFPNDFSALLPDIPAESENENGLFVSRTERGVCRVLCFSPRHDLTLALMDEADIGSVVDTWAEQYTDLGARGEIAHVQIFENRGAIMGCSNPHPHGQIWADETVPMLPARESECQREYFRSRRSCLLCDYIGAESSKKERIVFETDHFIALVPFWAVWPFETMIVSKDHLGSIAQLDDTQRADLASALRRMGIRFDNLFMTSFPYSMGIHQCPTDGGKHDEWHFHIHYYPPLLRSATVKKFMVGYEMLGMPQRDITAETSAQRLRECAEVHYTQAV
jgi:UDPglucose--hexose-1-phosphate uridylyltransferase